jgi:hypothetical protein
MSALSEQKLEVVRTLVETAPDGVVEGLSAALASAREDTALATVRRIVEVEAHDRQLRNLVLLPIAPMCVGDGRDPARLVFPARVLALIWRGLKAAAASDVREAELIFDDYEPGAATEPFDRLVRIAAQAIRAGDGAEFKLAAEACEEARASGAEALLACLDLAEVVRGVAHKLAEWAIQQSNEAAIGARLAYKDAVAIAPDAGPKFFQMLAAQLDHEWMILRIISAVMERPTERYMADSEVGIFAERVLADIEAALHKVAKIDLDGGAPAARQAARLVDQITDEISELETYVSLSREQGWGAALMKHRKALASIVEGRLRECEKYFHDALPSSRAKLQRIRRNVPKLSASPDQMVLRRCDTLLTFVAEIRHSANYGGFAAARSKLLETLGEHLDFYVEELLDFVKTGEPESRANARVFLGIAADLSRLVRDEKAADLVRRRTATAFSGVDAWLPEQQAAAGT